MKYFEFRIFRAVFDGEPTLESLQAQNAELSEKLETTTQELTTTKEALTNESKKAENLQVEFDAVKKKLDLSSGDTAGLIKKNEELEKELKTTKTMAEQESNKLKKGHMKESQELKTESEKWKGLFTSTLKDNAIISAAEKNGAWDPDQIISILKNKTKIVELTGNDGKPTGEYGVKVSMAFPNEKGESVELTLAPEEAVKKMKDTDKYLNLFKGEGSGGLHRRSTNQSGGNMTAADYAKSGTEAYRQARKEGKLGWN
jgi:hypothetical protein